MMTKAYLGVGVYVEYGPDGLTLTTERSVLSSATTYGRLGATNTIHLTPEVYHALLEFVARMESGSVEEPPR